MSAAASPILWALAHPADRAISFNFQAERVTRALAATGREVVVLDPGGGASRDGWHLPRRRVRDAPPGAGRAEVEAWVAETRARRLVFLGYPDQIPWLAHLAGLGVTILWWAQPSSAARAGATPPDAPIRVVPLTPIGARHLRRWARGRTGDLRVAEPIPHAVEAGEPPADAERAAAKAFYGLTGRFVVGSVGVHTARKRLPRLVRAFGAVERALPDAALLLKTTPEAADDGPDLHALATREGVRNLRFDSERRSEPEMRRLYAAMDLYVHAAEWEGFGIPVAEAMARGLAVLVPPIQGAGEIVPDARFVVAAGETLPSDPRDPEASALFHVDPEALAARVIELARDPATRATLARDALAHARARFAPEAVAAMWARLLEEES